MPPLRRAPARPSRHIPRALQCRPGGVRGVRGARGADVNKTAVKHRGKARRAKLAGKRKGRDGPALARAANGKRRARKEARLGNGGRRGRGKEARVDQWQKGKGREARLLGGSWAHRDAPGWPGGAFGGAEAAEEQTDERRLGMARNDVRVSADGRMPRLESSWRLRCPPLKRHCPAQSRRPPRRGCRRRRW